MTSNPAPNSGADGHDGDRDRTGAGDAGTGPAPRRADDCACGCDCGEGRAAERMPPAADGVAPSRSEVDGIDWSGGPGVAALGRLLARCASIDRDRREQVEALVRVVEEGAAEETFGVPLEVVLSQTGRATSFETRRLLRAARVLARMPAVRTGFADGWLSWSQVDAISQRANGLPVARWDELDTLVADRLVAGRDAEADAIVDDVDWAAAKIREQRKAERKNKAVEQSQLRFDVRTDTSGELHAEYGPDRFSLMEAAIDHAARQLIDNIPDPEDGLPEDADDRAVIEAYRHAARLEGKNAAARAAALFELVTGRDHDTLQPLGRDGCDNCSHDGHEDAGAGTADDLGGGPCDCDGSRNRPAGPGTSGGRGVVDRPGLVLTAPLASLLDGSVPAKVVSRLTARMQMSAAAARRIAAATDIDVRLVVVDGARPVGVGRATRLAPGWLRDAIIAGQPVDTAPCSNTPSVLCDMEHAVPYDDGGSTDVVNVAPVSRRWHTRKTSGDINLERDPDSGVATWTAAATGYTVVTWPAPHLDDPAHTARLTPPALRRLQDVPHPAGPADHVPGAKRPHTSGLDIRPTPDDLACTVFSHDGRQLVGDRAPP